MHLRATIVLALLCAFVILATYYQANVTQNLNYSREREVSANYAKYVGHNVLITGKVVSTGDQSFELKGENGAYTILSSTAVKPGDFVSVVGTLEPGNQLRAATIYASSPLLTSFVYIRSFIAFVFVALLFFMGWRFDRHGWIIRPREADGERTPRQSGA